MRLVLTNANLIDCVDPGVRTECSVSVEDGRIVEVHDDGRSPPLDGSNVVDLDGGYLLPGLWDAHVHLEHPRTPDANVAELTVQYAYNAARGLTEAGVVGLRTGGTPAFIDVALRDAFNSGQHVGPRIFAGGWFLTTTAG
ncbi:MAG: amidohydrolase family protein, partial [SAR202 cluster bacterium]|nr:amidohydrolase family protein [SAR202 cluster bacterium]